MRWPPGSQDSKPLDLFLWRYLQSKFHVSEPESLDDSRKRIDHEWRR